jgi:hypothetical protein
MRIRIVPQSFVERLGLILGLAPRPLIETMGGALLARSIMAGVKLGLFDALKDGPATADEMARRLGVTPEGIAVLANALASSDYLVTRDGRYALTPLARKWLVVGAPDAVVDFFLFMYDQWNWFGAIEATVRTGRSAEIHAPGQPREFWERYMRALADLARGSADEIVRAIPLRRSPRRMLDVGGGHGLFSAALCRRYPVLTSEILDLEDAIAASGPILDATRLGDRIRFRPGDLRNVEWGGDHDLILLFNICHHLTVEENRGAFARARASLARGGTLAVWDFQSTGDLRHPDQVGGLMGLFFYLTSGRRAYPIPSIRSWAAEAGLVGIRVKTLPRAPFGFLLTASAP